MQFQNQFLCKVICHMYVICICVKQVKYIFKKKSENVFYLFHTFAFVLM